MTRKTNLEAFAPSHFPMIERGHDLAQLIVEALGRDRDTLQTGDVLVLAQKIVSKAEGRTVDLNEVSPSPEAFALAETTRKDARLVQVILNESTRVVRSRVDSLIMEHKLGLIMAHAGVDQSNLAPAAGCDNVLLLPVDPDASAARLRDDILRLTGSAVAVVINDSFGRPWRIGSVGVAIGAAGLPSLVDRRGDPDLFGRTLALTVIGFADEIAAAASLLMGQADEATPVIVMRGLRWSAPDLPATAIVRPAKENLFS